MKRPSEGEASQIRTQGQADDGFAKKYPTILTYVLDCLWDDGKPREPSAVALTIKDGLWQVALNDKALKRSLYTSAATMAQALALLEKALADGVEAWRPWKRGK